MTILYFLSGFVSLACWIITLIQMFQREKPLLGILGILCALWAFIWGWMNFEKTGQKKLMLIWSGCICLGIISNAIAN